MGIIGSLVLLCGVLIMIIVAGLFITKAWWDLGSETESFFKRFLKFITPWWLRLGKTKTVLGKARNFLFWSFLVTWGSVGLIAFIVFTYITVAGETAQQTGGMASKGLLLLALGAIVAQGILAAVGAEYIREGLDDAPHLQGVYRDAIIGACISLGSAGSLFIWMIASRISAKKAAQQESQNKLNSAIITGAIAGM